MNNSNVETEVVQSQYGDVEIEVVDCDSCGNRVAKEDTVPFTIGDREGLACTHCESEGPVSFPRKVLEWSLPSDKDDDGLLFYLLFSPIFTPILTLYSFDGNEDTFVQGYGIAVVTLVVWGVIAYGVYELVL